MPNAMAWLILVVHLWVDSGSQKHSADLVEDTSGSAMLSQSATRLMELSIQHRLILAEGSRRQPLVGCDDMDPHIDCSAGTASKVGNQQLQPTIPHQQATTMEDECNFQHARSMNADFWNNVIKALSLTASSLPSCMCNLGSIGPGDRGR